MEAIMAKNRREKKLNGDECISKSLSTPQDRPNQLKNQFKNNFLSLPRELRERVNLAAPELKRLF
jgi:hypothetical protein